MFKLKQQEIFIDFVSIAISELTINKKNIPWDCYHPITIRAKATLNPRIANHIRKVFQNPRDCKPYSQGSSIFIDLIIVFVNLYINLKAPLLPPVFELQGQKAQLEEKAHNVKDVSAKHAIELPETERTTWVTTRTGWNLRFREGDG